MTRLHAASHRPRFASWAACVAAVALAAPALAAEPAPAAGELQVASVAAQGDVAISGTLELLHVAQEAGTGLPFLAAQGATLEWTQAEIAGSVVEAPGGAAVGTKELANPQNATGGPQRQASHDATFMAESAQSQYILHVYAADPLDYTATAGGVNATSLERAQFSKVDGIREPRALDPNHQDFPAYDFKQFPVGHDLVRIVPSGPATIAVQGTFVVEFLGISGTLVGDEGSRPVQSGTWREPVAPGAPAGTVYNERMAFVRMWVTDGRLTLSGAPADTQWAGPEATATVSGTVALASVLGTVTPPGGEPVEVNAARYVLDGRNEMLMEPREGSLDVGFTALDAQGRPIGATGLAAPALPAGFVGAAFVAIAAATAVSFGAWALRRRLRREPTLQEVEAALATGKYRRAARHAGLILRRRPGMETALISRAIALSKAGRNARAVAEVEDHLRQSDPSDGVLHYVLGVAYADLGRPTQAQAAFEEAVARTPSLMPEIRARLPTGSRSPAPSTKPPAESHGYA